MENFVRGFDNFVGNEIINNAGKAFVTCPKKLSICPIDVINVKSCDLKCFHTHCQLNVSLRMATG